jgi:hypothetical protein
MQRRSPSIRRAPRITPGAPLGDHPGSGGNKSKTSVHLLPIVRFQASEQFNRP